MHSPSCDFVVPVPRDEPWRDVRVHHGKEAVQGYWLRGEDARSYLRDQLLRTRRRELARWWHHDLYLVAVRRPLLGGDLELFVRYERSLEDPSGVLAVSLTCAAPDPLLPTGVPWRGVVRIPAKQAQGPVWSPDTRLVRKVAKDKRTISVAFAKTARPCMDQVVIAWESGGSQDSTLLLTDWPSDHGAGRFAVVLSPGAATAAPPPRALCLAIDKSASMRGPRWAAVQAGVRAIAASLRPQGPPARRGLLRAPALLPSFASRS